MFNKEQLTQLKGKLDKNVVKERSQAGFKLSYIEGWYAIQRANEIFGFGNWSRQTDYCKQVCEYSFRDKHKVGYEAQVTITVSDGNGNVVTRTGTGHGSGIAKDKFDAIEGAAKEAETDAMKRAFMTFGNQFGLALYDKEQAGVGAAPKPLEKRIADMKAYAHSELSNIKSLEELKKFEERFVGSKIEETMKDIDESIYNEFIKDLKQLKESLNGKAK